METATSPSLNELRRSSQWQTAAADEDGDAALRCRLCHAALRCQFVDLGMSPLCESFLRRDQLNCAEHFYPLRVYVCESCYLAQLEEYVSPADIFSEYAYFSSYSDSWVEHARRYVDMITARLGLGPQSQVVEVASNDGYLLRHFAAKRIPALGIEPAANVARAAIERGLPTLVKFFNVETARELASERGRADLILGNNVLAQVPDLNDFVAGIKLLLKPGGVVTLEFPHLLRLILENQFDTIYHEHFSYFSCLAVSALLARHGLTLFDVERLPTHGGSLRIYGRHEGDDTQPIQPAVESLIREERLYGLDRTETFVRFGQRVKETKRALLAFLIAARREGKQIVAYGAPGKGNTLLNYCGVRTDFVDYTVDRNPYKHFKYLPGTHIPIFPPDKLRETKPDYIMILPWNLKDEITQQLAYVREWGARFVIPIPEVHVC
jgi:SAM-dependent methyltransferase